MVANVNVANSARTFMHYEYHISTSYGSQCECSQQCKNFSCNMNIISPLAMVMALIEGSKVARLLFVCGLCIDYVLI